jgi:periplasmic nitrate reductase NapE
MLRAGIGMAKSGSNRVRGQRAVTSMEEVRDRSVASTTRRRGELLMFLFLTIVLWPAIAIAVVGGWGLAVWIYQALTGSPSL